MADNPHHISNMPKGRSKYLIERRNEALYKRYKHLLNVKKLRYSVVFSMLEQEFFLAEGTIMHIIREWVYREDKPAPKEFSGFRSPRRGQSRGQSSDEYEGALFAE